MQASELKAKHGKLVVGIFVVILLSTASCYDVSNRRKNDELTKKQTIQTMDARKPVSNANVISTDSSSANDKKYTRKYTITQHSDPNHKRTTQTISQLNETRSKRQLLQPGINPNIALNPKQNIAFNPQDQVLANQFASTNPLRGATGEDELRHRLLLTLENRLQERNMLLHDNEVLREKELFHEKEMNSLLSSHPSFLEGTGGGNSALMEDANRKSLLENNGLFPQLSRTSDPLSTQNNDLLDQSYMNPMGLTSPQQRLLGEEERLLAARNDMPALPSVGNLGDETMPYGSLGLSKSGYIPLGRVDDNQVINIM